MERVNLEAGDFVAGQSITTGKYLGVGEVHGKTFHKVFDEFKKMTVFIPTNEEEKIRKLPSKKSVMKALKIFDNYSIIDSGELEGSRYKYYKEKLKQASFCNTMEVFHDLNIHIAEKKVSVSERKMYSHLKEKLLCEISFILSLSTDDIESKYLS